MIVRRAIFQDLPAVRIAFGHLVVELETHRLVPYPLHNAQTLDDFTVHIAGRIGDPRLLLYVALEDETFALLGFLGGEISQRVLGFPTTFGAAHWLYVAPVARGLGVARALVRTAVGDLAAAGITHVELAALTGDQQWLTRGWAPYLVHYVLPLDAVAMGAAVRPEPPALEPAPALDVLEGPALEVAANGNGAHASAPVRRRRTEKTAPQPRGRIEKDTLLASIPLSVRAGTVLANCGCKTIGDVLRLTPHDVRRWKNCGRKTTAEIFDLAQLLRQALPEEP